MFLRAMNFHHCKNIFCPYFTSIVILKEISIVNTKNKNSHRAFRISASEEKNVGVNAQKNNLSATLVDDSSDKGEQIDGHNKR